MTASNPHSAPANVGASVHGGAETEIWESLLRSAIRAPSGHNTQPWRFQILGDRHHMSADRSRAQPVVDPEDRAPERRRDRPARPCRARGSRSGVWVPAAAPRVIGLLRGGRTT